jgi:hypothetical protein
MATTRIKQALNAVESNLMFLKLEDTGNNRYVPRGTPLDPSATDVGNCTVPHCDNKEEFLKKTIVIINKDKAQVIAYIWQHKSEKDDDAVRYSNSGWYDSGHKLSGYSDVGGNMDIAIHPDGTIEGKQLG